MGKLNRYPKTETTPLKREWIWRKRKRLNKVWAEKGADDNRRKAELAMEFEMRQNGQKLR
jgi:hypothetical protein